MCNRATKAVRSAWLGAALVLAMGCGGAAKTQDDRVAKPASNGGSSVEETATQYLEQAGLALANGDKQGALASYLEAGRLFDSTGAVIVNRAEAHFLAADLAYELDDLEGAAAEYDKAVQIYRRFSGNSKIKAANALANMGTIHKRLHDKAKARDCWEQALQLYKEAPPEIRNPANMATIEQNISDLDQGF